MKILPSLAAANQLALGKAIEQLDNLCDGWHLDVMDFHFVPNVTFGPQTIDSVGKASKKTLFVHLMVDNPDAWLKVLKLKPTSCVAFHANTSQDPHLTIRHIHENGWKPAIALAPHEPIEHMRPYLNLINAAIILSVRPGFTGQKMKQNTVDRIRQVVQMRKETGTHFDIIVDGGINKTTIGLITEAGADFAVVGSGIFDQKDPVAAFKDLV